jgi:nicotinamidase-related amidase
VDGERLVLARSALVNVDMQRRFVDRAARGREVLSQINALAAACRSAGIVVIHTAHVLRPDGSNMGLLSSIPAIRDGELNKGAETAALHPHLVVDERDVLVEKPRFGAFHGTDLELLLRCRGIDTVVITGISTPICCDTTAREAHARDFRVLLVSDATATTGDDADEAQRFTLELLDGMFGRVVSADEVLDMIKHGVN